MYFCVSLVLSGDSLFYCGDSLLHSGDYSQHSGVSPNIHYDSPSPQTIGLDKAWTKVRNFANIFTTSNSYVILWAY